MKNRNNILVVDDNSGIRAAMERYESNLTMVARSLETSRPTLYSKLKKYDI